MGSSVPTNGLIVAEWPSKACHWGQLTQRKWNRQEENKRTARPWKDHVGYPIPVEYLRKLANRQWKMSVNAHLWPYAVRMASEQINNTPRMQSKDKRSPMQEFAKMGSIPTSSIGTHLNCWYM
jgi:hypothetical protein